ncbi:dolichyl-diphosphooligosaccharide--protein glycotransferase OST3 SCDLUD_002937 [Saccharomycodes ludwigii]|uniref:dolichyl-diphosphooligosaccharide--protein glycotransferase OST3 n=1 Tax=Saccharomycodes ludwigii TaxID=36035 RepID=UPI001E8997F3|nr:hypothetical protein SCDLUD_002937 [Saccharomycodes ludwigii]KAH3901443.1 hypothetical protein SCDLUD_002937 [Saccharomycodes ludwigii]
MKVLELFTITLLYCTSIVYGLSNVRLLKETKRNGQNGIIKLTDKNFKRVLEGPRDSYIILLLTATHPAVGCKVCEEINPEYDVIAESWFHAHPDGINDGKKGLFFSKSDFIDGDNQELFKFFQVSNVPIFIVYKPTDKAGPESLTEYSMLNMPGVNKGKERIQLFINSISHHFQLNNFVIYEPINWGSRIITILGVSGIVLLLMKYRNLVKSVLLSKILWAIFSCLFIIIMCNGYMFNKIRGAPYAGGNEKTVEYFKNGMQEQFAIETQIVSFIYSTLGVAVLLLIKFVPFSLKFYEKKNKEHTAVLAYLGMSILFLVAIFIFYSALIRVFRMKYSHYPFKLGK